MMPLAAFADEISPDLPDAIEVLRAHGITKIDLRSVGNVNILDLDDRLLDEIARMLADEGIGVAAIATPIGKAPVDAPVGAERARFERALDVAIRLSAKYIRVFTGYGPDGGWRSEADRDAWSDEIAHRIADMGAGAAGRDLVLLVENDRATFAESPHRMSAVLHHAGANAVATAFDAANYVLCGFDSYPAFTLLRTQIGCLHVKDVDDTNQMTVAGQGRCGWPEILEALAGSSVRMYLSLEPHLQFAGPAGGFTGIDRFADAASALANLLDHYALTQKGLSR
jgi:3-dehydroshikimate dehydratase